MEDFVEGLIRPALPSAVAWEQLEVTAFACGSVCKILCPDNSIAKLIVDNFRDKLLLFVDEDAEIRDTLRIKFSEPFDVRKKAQFCFLVFSQLLIALQTSGIKPPTPAFITDKRMGKSRYVLAQAFLSPPLLNGLRRRKSFKYDILIPANILHG